MNKIFYILISLAIVSCSSDVGSQSILTDNGNGNTGGGFTGGGGGGDTIQDLSVELITTYDSQTASFSAPFGNFVRNFIVHVPPNFDSETQSLPLVFVLHGYTSQAPIIRQYSGFDQIADEEKFIAVYVQGTTDIYGNTGWNAGRFGAFTTVDDVGLFRSLINYFKSNYNINAAKIFSTGMSMGGFMSYRLACEVDDVNSVGSVTGSMGGYTACEPKTKKSIIHFHGEDDTVVPYDGGDWLYSANEAHEFWKNYNECSNQVSINLPDFNGDGQYTKKLTSYNCGEEKTVELYSLEGEGHTWFSQNWGHDVSSSELIWQFFKNQQ